MAFQQRGFWAMSFISFFKDLPDMNVKPQIFTFLKAMFLKTLSATILLVLHLLFGWTWVILFIFKYIAVTASEVFVPGVGRPLSALDALFLENYHERHSLSVVAMLTLQGDLSAAAAKVSFVTNVLQLKSNKDSSRANKFPELTQMQTSFLGFPFYKDDPQFDVGNHIHEVFYNANDMAECFKDYENMVAEFSGRPYPAEQSPWELWIIKNFPEGQGTSSNTVLLWRAHHALMDGFSILNVIRNLKGETPIIQKPLAKTLGQHGSANWSICSLLEGCRKGITEALENRHLKKSLLAARAKAGAPVRDKVHFRYSSKLPLNQVKAVAAKFGVRVSALLATLVAEGISKVAEVGHKNINALYVIPTPSHTVAIANDAHAGSLQLPISNSLPIRDKLILTNESFLRVNTNPINVVAHYEKFLLGNCPPAIIRFVEDKMFAPIAISNFAVGPDSLVPFGMECLEVRAGMGVPSGHLGALVGILGYKDSVQILFAAHDSYFTYQAVEKIVAEIEHNFEILMKPAP